ncbi:hypothetical protein ACFVUY_37885 [Kitasatospora sp. NPDC058063]|uniref:hypothetical protein n=1 Tax=unclassified Kitasatospora TaxID=2633591 RepID=UPI0036DF562C
MFSKSRLYKPAPRTAPLTAAMRAALTTIRVKGAAFSCNGISRPTVEALAAAGEIVLELTYTWGTTEARKPVSQGDWTAYPAPMPSPSADAIRIIRWRELTSLHLGCDCELTEGHELYRVYRAEKLAEAVAEAQSLATVNHPVHVCAKAPAGHTPAPGDQRSAAAIAAERPATPSEALARTLKRLGLAQGKGKDFRISGFYRNGERHYTYAIVLSRRAEELIAEHADRIEAELAAGPFPFRVSVRYTGHHPFIDVRNGSGKSGKGVRESAPTATPAGPAAEDVLDGIAAAITTLHAGAAATTEEPAAAEHPIEPVRTDRNGAPLATNAPVLLHNDTGRPTRGIVAGWAPTTGALLVSLPGGAVAHVTDAERVELSTTPALSAEEMRELLAAARAEEEPAAEANQAAGPKPRTIGAELAALLLDTLPEDVLADDERHSLITDAVSELFVAAEPGGPGVETLHAGFRAVTGWSQQIAGGRAPKAVRDHVNAMTGREFAELLGRMADTDKTTPGWAAHFFADLGRELTA